MRRLVVALLLLPAIPSSAQLTRTPVNEVSVVSLNPTSVVGGATVNGVVTLAQAAGGAGVNVTFASSNTTMAVVPASVVVQPGNTTAIFLIQTYPVASNPNVVTEPPTVDISARIGLSAKSARLTVLPASLTSLTLNPASIAGSNAAIGQIALSGPAPTGGFTIALQATTPETSSRPILGIVRLQQPAATVPPQIVVPAGASSASFSIATRAVPAVAAVQIDATYGPFVTRSATLTVLPPAVSGIALSPSDCVVPGQPVTATIQLTAAAPAEGMAIPLSLAIVGFVPYGPYCPSLTACGTPPVVPASVQIPAGSNSTAFQIDVSQGQGCYRLSAADFSASLRVSPPLVNASNHFGLPQSVKGGTALQGNVQLTGIVTNCGGGPYHLKSSDTNLAQVTPADLVLPVGSTSGSFTVTTAAVPSNQNVTISVTGCFGSCCANYGAQSYTLTLVP